MAPIRFQPMTGIRNMPIEEGSRPKLVGVACVKNEEDIIEAFARHNLALLDQLIVLDHGSADDTPRILARLQEEGLDLTVVQDNSLGKFQGEKMTRLMKTAVKEQGADWVFLLDGDEFIQTDEDFLPMPPVHDQTPVLKVPWTTYCATVADPVDELNPVKRIQHRFREELSDTLNNELRQYFFKAVVPKTMAVMEGAVISEGNHIVTRARQEVCSEEFSGFRLAHYSLRSSGQYGTKVAINMLQHRYKTSFRSDMSCFYSNDYREMKSDFDAFHAAFHEKIPAYMASLHPDTGRVHDPLRYRGGNLKYTRRKSEPTKLISNLLQYAENQADLLSEQAESDSNPFHENDEIISLACKMNSASEASDPITRTVELVKGNSHLIRFNFPPLKPTNKIKIKISGCPVLVDILEIRFLDQKGQSSTELKSLALISACSVSGYGTHVSHDHYFSFLKGSQHASLTVSLPRNVPVRKGFQLEIDAVITSHSEKIASRLFHRGKMDKLIKKANAYDSLKAKMQKMKAPWYKRLPKALSGKSTLRSK